MYNFITDGVIVVNNYVNFILCVPLFIMNQTIVSHTIQSFFFWGSDWILFISGPYLKSSQL